MTIPFASDTSKSTAPYRTGVPGMTIVVPTRDRPRRLSSCLEALATLQYPRDRMQVVIVDDGSVESPRPVVDRFRGRIDIQLVEQEASGPAVARNAGVARARHEYVAFTDDDCAPEPEWLLGLAAGFRRSPRAMLGGRTVNALPANLFSEASQELVSYLYEYYNSAEHGARFLTSNNMATPTELFREVGGFHASFPRAAAEDRDLCDRWHGAGHAMWYVPDAVVRHSHALGWNQFWRQHFGYGQGAHGYHTRRAERGEEPVRPEPLGFYAGMLAHPVRSGAGLRAPSLSALLALAQIANAVGYLAESRGRPARRKGGQPARRNAS